MKKVYFYLKLVLILIMVFLSLWFYGQLPEMVPIHWNYAGVPDDYGTKEFAVILFPAMSVGVLILFMLLPMLDPKKEKYQKFQDAYEMIQLVIMAFFTYMYAVTLFAAMNPEINVGQWVVSGIGVMLILIGNYLSKVRQNFFVGIKTPWTLASEEVWNKTHRLGAWCFVIAGLILLVMALMGNILLELFVPAMVVALVVPIVYSYLISVKKR
ncbi:MAG: SdpI family protein [Patescibacteria group bacterium]